MASTKRKATGERRLEIVQAARDILIFEGFHKQTLRMLPIRLESPPCDVIRHQIAPIMTTRNRH